MTKEKLQAQLDILREAYSEMLKLPHLPDKEIIHQLADSIKEELKSAAAVDRSLPDHDYTHASLDILADTPTFPSIDSLTTVELKNALNALPGALTWIDKLKAHARNEILNGEEFGYKLRKSPVRRAFKKDIDLKFVAFRLGLPEDVMYETKEVSASKLCKDLSKEQIEVLADYIDEKYGEPALVKID